ncbi:hypothetical protein JHL21_09625 [Devosia sp. WQ 349]|uniref:hypothetical protein n=1 Tax=Devosia sp. WQ 349K1 TaxID=2800329 RepID=UPI001906BB87|nr:hypothetical protein [Devosia sp. WQ 349K1]MBK1794761.1 hypothetical protein [Devosia sp. WQ 349K1]
MSVNWPWSELGLDAPAQTDRAVKRAYASKLRTIDVDVDIAGFATLRAAYDAALRNVASNAPPAPRAPASVPADVPASAPADAPASVPADVPASAPADAPASVPADVPASAPADAPVSVPADVPASAPADAPASVPADVPASAPADAPASAPADTQFTAPDDEPIRQIWAAEHTVSAEPELAQPSETDRAVAAIIEHLNQKNYDLDIWQQLISADQISAPDTSGLVEGLIVTSLQAKPPYALYPPVAWLRLVDARYAWTTDSVGFLRRHPASGNVLVDIAGLLTSPTTKPVPTQGRTVHLFLRWYALVIYTVLFFVFRQYLFI